MPYEELTSKEKAGLFLGAMLRKLPPTHSGKGFFVAREDRHKIISMISGSLARIVYAVPFYSVSYSDEKANLCLKQADFRIVVEILLFARLSLLPSPASFHNCFKDNDNVDEFVKSIIDEIDGCGFFGNMKWFEKSPMSAVRTVTGALRQVAANSKWLECR